VDDDARVDPGRIGATVRQLRIRARWRQVDLAVRAGVPVKVVGSIEHGRLDGVPIGQLGLIAVALGGSLDLAVRWHGGDLARVLNGRHAAMHEAVARHFGGLAGWVAQPEVSFSIFGERGVIDVLAWHASTRTLLVIELKTELVDIGGLLGQVDRYRRLARAVAGERGWRPEHIAVWVVVAPSRTNARRLADHATVIRTAFPDDGRKLDGWLADPSSEFACLSFLPNRLLAPLRQSLERGRRVVPRDGSRARAQRGPGKPTNRPDGCRKATENMP
jgi:transcriptional regulator with XRE-family HTH domain